MPSRSSSRTSGPSSPWVEPLKVNNDLPYTHKILIAGNHDFFFEEAPEYEIEAVLAKYPNITYLNESQ